MTNLKVIYKLSVYVPKNNNVKFKSKTNIVLSCINIADYFKYMTNDNGRFQTMQTMFSTPKLKRTFTHSTSRIKAAKVFQNLDLFFLKFWPKYAVTKYK